MKRKRIKGVNYVESYNSTWKWEFNFFLDCEWQNFRKSVEYWEKTDMQEREPLAFCFTNWGNRRSYIWVADVKNSASLAHECIHAATRCLNQSGVEIHADNDEPLAYLVTWMMKEAFGEKHR